MSTILLEGDTSPIVVFVDTVGTFDDYMRPATTEKYVYAGDSPTFNFTIREAGVAKNLNGLSLSFAAKVSTASSSFIFNVAPNITDAVNGLAQAIVPIPCSPQGECTAEVAIWSGGAKLLTALQFPLFIGSTVS